MYWIPNNFISLAQTRVLKTAPMKKYFNIPEPPPVDPFAKQEPGALQKLQQVKALMCACVCVCVCMCQ
jgi:membrane protein insertase Oxa1/YidC/SpoIIIJ